MNQQTSEALRIFFRRVTGIYPELFNTAHVICGNYDLAEYVVRNAILTTWQQNVHGGMGFNETLRSTTKRLAMKEALAPAQKKGDFTWHCLDNEESENIFIRQASQESPAGRRAIMLRYGCHFSARRISRITEIPVSQLKSLFNRFETRCRRRIPPKDRRRFESLLSESIALSMKDPSNMPDPTTMYRAFEAEAAETEVVTHSFSKWLGYILTFILAIVCALIFWLFAVISAPPAMENPSLPAESASMMNAPAQEEFPALNDSSSWDVQQEIPPVSDEPILYETLLE